MLNASPNKKGYGIIISIFAHTPSNIRKIVHSKIFEALLEDGYFLLQAYTPDNIGRNTGGPQDADSCMSQMLLCEELHDLIEIECNEIDCEINEGKYHHGLAAVVQGLFQNENL